MLMHRSPIQHAACLQTVLQSVPMLVVMCDLDCSVLGSWSWPRPLKSTGGKL